MGGQLEAVRQDICSVQERIVKYEQKLATAERAGNKEEEKPLFDMLLSLNNQLLSLNNQLLSLNEKENILLRSQAPSQSQELVRFWAKPYRQQLQAIRPSHSAYSNPVIFVRKSLGSCALITMLSMRRR
ncbi:TPA: hypothetical protein ACH3X1_016034 [Trebouxia sp. C0004]